MKKTAVLLLAALFLLPCCTAQTGYIETEQTTATDTIPADVTPVPNTDLSDRSADLDLTAVGTQMAYVQLSNMMLRPEDYAGKTVKLKGTFAHTAEEGKEFFVCYVMDATACCSQSLEFETDETYPFPAAYPAERSEITVYGTFDTYEYNGYQMYRLLHAELMY